MTYERVVSVLNDAAKIYAKWFADSEVVLMDYPDFIKSKKRNEITGTVWTSVDFWDAISLNLGGQEVEIRGAGFVQREPFAEEKEERPLIAIAKNASQEDFVLSEILLPCESCEEDEDEDCEFCYGELEARFELLADGTWSEV
jgi:hypothetical protein